MATITGTSGPDTLSGTAGDDTLSGLDGNDTLEGGSGDDILDGGAGVDRVFIFNSTGEDVVIDLAAGTASGQSTGHDTLVNIESAYASGRTVTVIGDGGENFLSAFGGKVVFVSAGAGNDFIAASAAPGSVLDGGSGQNLLNIGFVTRYTGTFTTVAPARTTPVQFTFTPGVSGNVEGLTYTNIQYLSLLTGDGNDAVTFVMPQTSIASSLGTFFDNNWMAGGGTDTVTVDLSGYSSSLIMTTPVQSAGVYRADIVTVPDNGPSGHIIHLENVENYRLIGGSARDILATGSGNDILTGGGGDDTLDGGQGTDIARYSGLRTDYRIEQLSTSGFRITDLRAGSPDGTDTIANIDRLQWGDGSTTGLYNGAPIVEGLPVVARPGQTLALTSLITVTDYDGDAITRYQLWDATRDAASGHFVVNGVVQAAGAVIEVSAAQLNQVSFVAGSIGDSLQIRAFDGDRWSAGDADAWSTFSVTINRPPSATTANRLVGQGQSVPLSSLVSVSDADQDLVRMYQLWDSSRDPNSGYFVVNGVRQAAGAVIQVYGSQIDQVSFVAGTAGDSLQIRAFDGIEWSAADNAAWSPFSIAVNLSPVVVTSDVRLAAGQTVSLASLFSVSDPEGDTITKYQLWDANRDANSGHFADGGAVYPAGSIIEIPAAQLAQTSFVAGTVNDNLQIRAFDGTTWSAASDVAWSPFVVGPTVNHAPGVTTGSISRRPGVAVALSGLVTVTDVDGDTIQKYQLWDSGRDPNSGHFVVNGVDRPSGTVIEITAAQAAQTSFVFGTVADTLQIRAFDGVSWSAGENAAWAPFTASVLNAAPVVTTANVTRSHLQTLALSSLISVTDGDGDTPTKYQLWDSTRDAASGHFVVNGVDRPAGTIIEISAAQLAQTSFVTGTVGDTLQVRAFDGMAWSAGDNAAWSPFTITVPANNAPVLTTADVNTTANQTLSLASLFNLSDTDGDTPTRYQLWDSTRDPASGHFVVNGADQPAGTVIDISAAQLAQTSFFTGTAGDALQIRAFDGIAWSAADSASWSPFHINV